MPASPSVMLPWSIFQAVCRVSSSAARICVAMSARTTPLVAADRLAELFAVGRPLQRRIQRALGLADAVGGDHHPAGGQPGVGHVPALADFTEHLGGRYRQSSKNISKVW
jgi:hypothetical protein